MKRVFKIDRGRPEDWQFYRFYAYERKAGLFGRERWEEVDKDDNLDALRDRLSVLASLPEYHEFGPVEHAI